MVNENFNFLILNLKGVESIKYDAWTDESFIMDDWTKIFNLGIVILSVETDKSEQIVIHSSCHNSPNDKFQGGKLIAKCQDYELFDESERSLSIEKLKKISTYYWNEKFGKP